MLRLLMLLVVSVSLAGQQTAVAQASSNASAKTARPAAYDARIAANNAEHPTLAVGSPIPASALHFAMQGVDGKMHELSDYAKDRVLAVIFTCNSCPIAQIYESRIEKLYETYKDRGVAVVVIEGDDPSATRIGDLDFSDMGDTLGDMRLRVKYRRLTYPYLYDGDAQKVTQAFGPRTAPHVFIFGPDRRLSYEGDFDNSYRTEKVTTHDAQNAIDELLASKPVKVTHTAPFGCSTKWAGDKALVAQQNELLDAAPVTVNMANAAALKKLRANAGDSYTLVDFWATWCGPCEAEFSDFQETYRMFKDRPFKLVTVSVNAPDEKQDVLRFLKSSHATSENLLFGSDDAAALEAAFDPGWQNAVPYMVLLGPNGKVLDSLVGSVDFFALRRRILQDMPANYIGFNKYWAAGIQENGN